MKKLILIPILFFSCIAFSKATTKNSIMPKNHSITKVEKVNFCSDGVLRRNLDVTVTVTNISCSGQSDGSINTQATGGQSPYTYELTDSNQNLLSSGTSNVFLNLSPGNYTVAVTDVNSEIITLEVIVLEPAPIEIAITSLPSGNDASGNIKIEATGGNGDFMYSIDNGVTYTSVNEFFNLEPGDYEVTVIDNNACITTFSTVTIGSVIADNRVSESINGGLEASNKNAISYQWINVDTQTRIAGATSSSFIPSQYGIYQVEITIAEGSRISGKALRVKADLVVLSPTIEYTSGVLGVEDVTLNSFNIYPIPADEFINIPPDLLNNNYKIYSLSGKKMYAGRINKTEISLINYAKGVYFLKVDGYTTIKFIKK